MKLLIAAVSVLLILVLAYIAFINFGGGNELKSDKHLNYWAVKCGTDSKCQEGVKQNYDSCIDVLSFEKPEKDSPKQIMDEYFSLVKIEISECLLDKTGLEFSPE